MKRAILFLHGRYPAEAEDFYRENARRRAIVAVDGGYRYVRRMGMVPDALVGDFDSLHRLPKDLPEETEVLAFPISKDQTDAQLALEYCVEEGSNDVLIADPSYGDADHFLGNVFLLTLGESYSRKLDRDIKVLLINHRREIRLIRDGTVTFRNASGQGISIVPLSTKIRLTCSGTEYRAERALIRQGHTVGLRNRITAQRARFEIEGAAFVVRLFS
jgi:thiamine pyrophosphokinase